MNTRIYPVVFGMTLIASMALLVTGCNRQEAETQSAVVPPSTTLGTEIDDTVVTTKVKSALLGDMDVKGLDIKVETHKGVVQLSGFVDSQTQVELAIARVRSVEGVKGVENGMTLKEGKVTVGHAVDDSVVTSRVKSALLSNPGIKSLDIAVVTRNGEVQLSGFVDSQTQIDSAITLTRSVEGVQGVVNEMSIKK